MAVEVTVAPALTIEAITRAVVLVVTIVEVEAVAKTQTIQVIPALNRHAEV